MDITEAHIEALEILVKSGRVSPQAVWADVMPEATAYILALAERLTSSTAVMKRQDKDTESQDKRNGR